MSESRTPQGAFAAGDRVRIVAADNPYTGCRGTVAPAPYQVPEDESGLPLGYYVAVDGEQGGPQPFLGQELERVRVARVRPPEPEGGRRPERETGQR